MDKSVIRIRIEKVTNPHTINEEWKLMGAVQFDNASSAFFALLSLQHKISDLLDPDESEVR